MDARFLTARWSQVGIGRNMASQNWKSLEGGPTYRSCGLWVHKGIRSLPTCSIKLGRESSGLLGLAAPVCTADEQLPMNAPSSDLQQQGSVKTIAFYSTLSAMEEKYSRILGTCAFVLALIFSRSVSFCFFRVGSRLFPELRHPVPQLSI
jgi:hypothetical protein